MELNKVYKELIKPINILREIGTRDKFIDWVGQGSREDLVATLKAFEESELFEECVIIQSRIQYLDAVSCIDLVESFGFSVGERVNFDMNCPCGDDCCDSMEQGYSPHIINGKEDKDFLNRCFKK